MPYREFSSRDGHPLRVGRSAKDNDALTLHHARPNDLFLHARDCPGAHVVVPLPKDSPCPPERLIDAATLAAHFSRFRDEPIVDISYANKRHVRKAKGAPPGEVLLRSEKVLVLRVDASLVQRLIASERPR